MARNNAEQDLAGRLAGVQVYGEDTIEALIENSGYLREDVSEFIRTIETQLPEVEKCKTDTRAKIVDLMHGIRMKIEDRERELLKQNEQLFTASLNELNSCLATSKTLAKEVDVISRKAKEAQRYGAVQGDHGPLNQEFRDAQSKSFDIQDRLTCPDLNVLENDEDVVKGLLFAEFNTRSIIQKEEKNDEIEDFAEYDKTPEFDFCCRTPRDQKDPYITGMTWINKKLVIADKSNRKLKFFLENEDFLHEILFSVGEPYGVCFTQMNSSNIETYAVTIPKAKMLFFVNMAANGFSQPTINRNLNTQVGYSGISCLGKILAATAVNIDFPRLDIIDFNGYCLRSFAIDADQSPLFSFPRYVTTDVTACIVSDWKKNKMMILREQDGAIFGTYTGTAQHPLKDPYDVATDGNGYIFIMDGKTGMIHVVDRSFRLVQLIEDTKDLLGPRLLAYDIRTGYLALTYAVSNVKCVPAPSAVQRYESISNHTKRRGSGVPDAMMLSVPAGSQFRSPSPGF